MAYLRPLLPAAALLMAFSGPSSADPLAVKLSIQCSGTLALNAVYRDARQVIAFAVGDGEVDRFVVYGAFSSDEASGFDACAEVGAGGDIVSLVRRLRAITPEDETTSYTVSTVDRCQEEQTICPAYVKACPDGSYVSPIPPTCAFAPCPGEVTIQ